MPKQAASFVLAAGLLALPPAAIVAQTEPTEQTSTSALIETAGTHLDSMLVAMNQRNFDETDQALTLTDEAIEYAEQMADALAQLAGHDAATDVTTFMAAEATADQVAALLRTQRRALETGQRDRYATARVDIHHLLGELPIERVFGANTETSSVDQRAARADRPQQ